MLLNFLLFGFVAGLKHIIVANAFIEAGVVLILAVLFYIGVGYLWRTVHFSLLIDVILKRKGVEDIIKHEF